MGSRSALRISAVATLIAAATSAGASVYSPADWPVSPTNYPQIVVRTPRDRKENAAPRMGVPSFFTIITLAVTGRVSATTEAAAETAIEALSLQIENALLTNAQFIVSNEIQQFVSVSSETEVKADGETHIGDALITFEIETPQFYEMTIDAAGAPVGQPLTEVQGTVTRSDTGEPLATFDVQIPQ